MSWDSNYVTTSTTLTARVDHPVRQFLESAGVNVSEFPRLRFLVEVDEFFEKTYSVRIPLRLPASPGWIHDLVFRVTRTIELPRADLSGHQKLLELECIVDEEPMAFKEQHLSSHFLVDVMECPNCRGRHPIHKHVTNSKTIQLSCEQCLGEWTMSVEASTNGVKPINIITDQYFSEPLRLAKWIRNSGSKNEISNDLVSKNLFSYRLSRHDGIDWGCFGKEAGDCLISKSITFDSDFAQFIKSIFNFLGLRSLEAYFENRKSNLDDTDVCRKSLLRDAPKDSQFELKPVGLEDFSFKLGFNPSSVNSKNELRLQRKSETSLSKNSPNRSALIAFVGAAFVFASLSSYFFYERHQRIKKVEIEKSLESVSKEAVEEKLASINPASQEIKIPAKENNELKEEIHENPSLTGAQGGDVDLKQDLRPLPAKETQTLPVTPPVVAPAAKKKAPLSMKGASQESIKKTPAAIDPRAALVEAGFRQGILHLKLQQAKQAAEEFERIIEIDPNHLESYRNLGLAYVYERRFEDAIKIFEKYISFKRPEIDYASVEELISTLKERVKIGKSQ